MNFIFFYDFWIAQSRVCLKTADDQDHLMVFLIQ
jgi:hypothetical protein